MFRGITTLDICKKIKFDQKLYSDSHHSRHIYMHKIISVDTVPNVAAIPIDNNQSSVGLLRILTYGLCSSDL